MARILLTVVYDKYALGLRFMAANLRAHGHEVLCVCLENEISQDFDGGGRTRIYSCVWKEMEP